MKFYTKIHQTLQDQLLVLMHYSKKKYVKEGILGIFATIIILTGYVGFSWYQKRQNMKAFAALIEISKSYQASLQKAHELDQKTAEDRTENPWEDTQLLLEALSSTHTTSSLSPFFLMYQAQLALDIDHDLDAALILMKKGLNRLPKKSPLYGLFEMKYTKMLLDSPMQNIRDQAVVTLEKIGCNDEHYFAQEALWILGSYQAFYGNMDAAITAWKKLASITQSETELIKSPFVIQAQDKLKTLNIDVTENK